MKVVWDADKARRNREKHGVSFEEAETIFRDSLIATIDDVEHSFEEDRMLAIGQSMRGELVVAVYAIGENQIRLIMARRPTPAETRRYMRGDRIRDKEAAKLDLEDFPEVDFTNAVRGRHYMPPRGVLRVSIDAEVARHYPDDDAVNDALRMLIAEGRVPKPSRE